MVGIKLNIQNSSLQEKIYEPKVNTQRVPPPYHIAAAYSKQVTFFNNENLSWNKGKWSNKWKCLRYRHNHFHIIIWSNYTILKFPNQIHLMFCFCKKIFYDQCTFLTGPNFKIEIYIFNYLNVFIILKCTNPIRDSLI